MPASRKTQVSLGLMATLVATPLVQNEPSAPPKYDDATGYAVLSLLLDTLPRNQKDADSSLRIFHLTVSDRYSTYRLQDAPYCKIPPGFDAAADDFEKREKTQAELVEKFQTTRSYVLLNESVPGGVYYVSQVGFDKDNGHAVALVDYICGNLCGSGRFYFLERGTAGWRLLKVRGCGWLY